MDWPISTTANMSSIKGELQSVDGYMNIALEKTDEYVNGQLKRSYGDAFVRGNNGRIAIESALNAFTDTAASDVHFIRLVMARVGLDHGEDPNSVRGHCTGVTRCSVMEGDAALLGNIARESWHS